MLALLWRPHLAQKQFQTPLGMGVTPGDGVVVIRTPASPNSDSAEFNPSGSGIYITEGVVLGFNWL